MLWQRGQYTFKDSKPLMSDGKFCIPTVKKKNIVNSLGDMGYQYICVYVIVLVVLIVELLFFMVYTEN